MKFHLMAFIMGFILDLLLGDPHFFPHPVRWIGNLISFLTGRLLRKNDRGDVKRKNGTITVVIVVALSTVITALIMYFGYIINTYLGIIIETIITYQCIAAKSLYTESMRVYRTLEAHDISDARKTVSMIVGRDTDKLDEAGIIRATVETVAENTSDGIVAPLIFLAIGGPVLGICYKSINTMDSMIGYKNDKYMDFGRTAAKLDDVVNFIPARISAGIMIFSAFILGEDYDGANALRIFKRDRYRHGSPNSAQTESVCAGALYLRLVGPSYYFGNLVDKPYIGDDDRAIELLDIKRANVLMLTTAIICFIMCSLVLFLIFRSM